MLCAPTTKQCALYLGQTPPQEGGGPLLGLLDQELSTLLWKAKINN
jgi:hypothetical protein